KQIREGHPGVESEVGKGDLEFGRILRDGNVSGASKDRRDSDALALDRGDRRNWDLQNREPTLIELEHECEPCVEGQSRCRQPGEHLTRSANGEVPAMPADYCGA